MFVLSSLLIGQETETENKNYPKRIIHEPYDLDKGWFFYNDSIFINYVLEDILNNLDPRFFNSGFISGGFLNKETHKTFKQIPLELFYDKNNWKIKSLCELNVEKDRIIQGVFLMEFKGDLKKYLDSQYLMTFTKPEDSNNKEGFSLILTNETPEAESKWEEIKSLMCRNCK